MNNCKNCKYHYSIEEVKPFPGGAEIIFLDGYACIARTLEGEKVRWYVNTDENIHCCDKFKHRVTST